MTAEDVAKFNEQWMQPYERQQALVFAHQVYRDMTPTWSGARAS
jgi:hypothetical protein